jgi:nucleotide-binding universal stress UspA family protein
MLMPTKILVPTDFSSHSDKALRQAFDIAMKYKAQVYVVHVLHEKNPYDTSDGSIPSYYEDIEKQLIERARKKLQEEIDKFPQAKELDVFVDVVNGNTAEAILEVEKSKGIDLIVIASLGKSGIAKYLIGGVARNVLKGAQCPVLLTK